MASIPRSHGWRRLVPAALAAAFAVGGLGACSGGDDRADSGLSIMAEGTLDGSSTTTTSTTAPPASTSTSSTVTTVAGPPTTEEAPPPGLGPGATGPAVASLEQKLASLHYEVGSLDDTYDQDTAYAVTAFQKVTGGERTGRATDDVIASLNATTSSPPAIVPGGGANRVEVDLARQVLFLYEGDALAKILTVSSGSGERFCSEGWCRLATTETGSFRVYRQALGWEEGPLGSLYNPSYFDGGIAIHGARSVPAEPASHGCVRIPMNAAEWFQDHIPLGTPVYVADAGVIPAPMGPEPPPDAGNPGSGTPPITELPTPPTTRAPNPFTKNP